ncbi:MAG: Ribosomal-protein-alanine acetyltransferase [Deltaproteobacteria bacterium]|nr:Ribosomal-protein-alanine acetyltransferase [Deltaproteobacteria bacterium]
MITLLTQADLPALCEHLRRHVGQAGHDGEAVSSPRSPSEPFDAAGTIDRHRAAWARRPDEPLWMRTWGLVLDGSIRGHVDLHGGRMAAESHRTILGMGIERAERGKGHGRALLETAIAAARRLELAWVDLGVFADNVRARALYASAGFVELTTIRDRFRVDGQRIDEISMTLALGPR